MRIQQHSGSPKPHVPDILETRCSCKVFVTIYQSARYHKPENCHIDTTIREDYLLLRLFDQAAGKENSIPIEIDR